MLTRVPQPLRSEPRTWISQFPHHPSVCANKWPLHCWRWGCGSEGGASGQAGTQLSRCHFLGVNQAPLLCLQCPGYRSADPNMSESKSKSSRNTALAKKCVQIFPYHLKEKSHELFGQPNSYCFFCMYYEPGTKSLSSCWPSQHPSKAGVLPAFCK